VRPRGINREGFAALLPLRQGEDEGLRASLRELPAGRSSPFARLDGTHFVRLTVVSPLLDRRERAVSGVPACLFFSAEFDSFAGGYLETLCARMPDEADLMFGRCVGYPGSGAPSAFASWMLQHRVRAGFSVHGNPGATAAEVERSLALRERLISFAVETRGLEPKALLERWAQWEARK
jgi:hypothetical protein